MHYFITNAIFSHNNMDFEILWQFHNSFTIKNLRKIKNFSFFGTKTATKYIVL